MTKQKTISKDTPLAELTLRRYEKPGRLSKRDLIRKLCLSIGLLQPGDSRDVIVDVFAVLVKSRREMKALTSEEVKDESIKYRKEHNLPLKGIASSNIRRQLKRLKDLHLIEKRANKYRITEFEELVVLFEEKIERILLTPLRSRVKEYFDAVK